MVCPKCQAKTTVVKIKVGMTGDTGRLRECPQHGRFWSRESLFKWLPVPNRLPQQTSLKGTGEQPADPSSLGGMGGQISGSILRLVTDQDPISSVKSKGSRARRGRGDALEYTPEFNRLWGGCVERRGNKSPAFNAYVKFKPATPVEEAAFVDLVILRYEQRRKTEQWQRGIIPHLSTILNAKFWEVEPTASEYGPGARPGRATGYAPVTSAPKNWHAGADKLKGAQ